MIWASLAACLGLVAVILARGSATGGGVSEHEAVIQMVRSKQLDEAMRLLAQFSAQGIPDKGPTGSPPLSHSRGLVLYYRNDLAGAQQQFKRATMSDPGFFPAWSNLADTLLYQFRIKEAIHELEHAAALLGRPELLGKEYRARAWLCDWKRRDFLEAYLEHSIATWGPGKPLPPITAMAMNEIPPGAAIVLTRSSAHEHLINHSYLPLRPFSWVPSQRTSLRLGTLPAITPLPSFFRLSIPPSPMPTFPPIHPDVGFISADFGIHPVATLIRGALQQLQKHNEVRHTGRPPYYPTTMLSPHTLLPGVCVFPAQ